MAILNIPIQNETISNPDDIKKFLNHANVYFDQWNLNERTTGSETAQQILDLYKNQLEPFMKRGGYAVADVVVVNAQTPNMDSIRQKFLAEHTHTEDEIRFFVKGGGYFWFNLPLHPVFCLTCGPGDLISVPKNSPHWFDLGVQVDVVAIRIFIDPSGWVPLYTGSGIEKKWKN